MLHIYVYDSGASVNVCVIVFLRLTADAYMQQHYAQIEISVLIPPHRCRRRRLMEDASPSERDDQDVVVAIVSVDADNIMFSIKAFFLNSPATSAATTAPQHYIHLQHHHDDCDGRHFMLNVCVCVREFAHITRVYHLKVLKILRSPFAYISMFFCSSISTPYQECCKCQLNTSCTRLGTSGGSVNTPCLNIIRNINVPREQKGKRSEM